MRALTIKLWRDTWRLRGQATAIALVIVAGVAVCIMSLSTYDALQRTRDAYYREAHFADVFAAVKRAPNTLLARIGDIPGVAAVSGRVVAAARIVVPGFDEPVTGQVVSLPDAAPQTINRVYLKAGRLPAADNEVLLSDAFAQAHGLKPGDTVAAVINGHRQALTVTGIGLSPEYIYQIAPGAVLPDFKRFGVMWMSYRALAKAYDMDGAFNNVALVLARGASIDDVITRLDRLLARYGGQGAYGRADQLSNRFLREEFRQLRTMAYLFPAIFLSVAVFLINVVLHRLITTQRENIAALKAFGYGNLAVGWHYTQFVLLVAAAGIAGGIALGAWLGAGLGRMYMDYYRFPYLLYRLDPVVVIAVSAVTAAAALLACWRAVAGAARLPPAQAMQPEPPGRYRPTLLERAGLGHWLSPPIRMVWRHLERRPSRTLLSVLGVAAACAILMVGNFQADAVRFMIYVQFGVAQTDDVNVAFTEPVAAGALSSLRGLEGVRYVEGYRSVPVRLVHRNYRYRTSVQGLDPGSRLEKVLNTDLVAQPLPAAGVLINERLAKILHAKVGDRLTVEVLEGNRAVVTVPVAAITRQYLGVGAYMRRSELNRVLREGDAVNGALLALDRPGDLRVFSELRRMPRVAGVGVRRAMIRSFNETLGKTLLLFTFINMLMGGIIAFGVIYNLARLSLSERARELASLRVLGYTRWEVAYILMAELAVFTVAGLLPGIWLGRNLCRMMAASLASDLYYVPLVLEPRTYAIAALTVVLSALASALVVWYRVVRLNLVDVLKTRE